MTSNPGGSCQGTEYRASIEAIRSGHKRGPVDQKGYFIER